jgi:hypothetical protein
LPLDIYAKNAFIEDELVDEYSGSPSKRKARGSDVKVETGSPRKKRRVTETMRVCGAKRVENAFVE